MSDFGVTDDGRFERKHINDIIDDLEKRIEQELGDVDLKQSSPLKQIIDLVAIEIARQWEVSEENYHIGFYQDTYGEALDKMLALAGFSRRELRGATGEVEFTVSNALSSSVRLDEGFEVTTSRTENRPRIPFKLSDTVRIEPGDNVVTAPIVAKNPTETQIGEEWLGEETNVEANTITNMPNPVSGIKSVTNPEPTGDRLLGYRPGRDRETDAEFRVRYENSFAEAGSSTIKAIESYVFQFDDDIKSVNVSERRDGDTQEFGPEVTVFAPEVDDDRIAQAVFESRAAGLESFGDESGIAEVEDGREFTESFDRATRTGILVLADLTVSDTFSLGGDEDIGDSLIRFIGGTGRDDVDYPGLEIGEDVIYDQVKHRVMEVGGVVSANVFVGRDDPGQAQEAGPDDDAVTDTSERGVRIEADESRDHMFVEARISENVEGATTATLYDSNGNDLTEKNISDVEAGEWFRFSRDVISYEAGDEFDIGLDADGQEYTIGRDTNPAYPYDETGPGVSITQRFRGDIEDDTAGTDTRPNVDAVRLNDVNQHDIDIDALNVAMTDLDDIEVVGHE